MGLLFNGSRQTPYGRVVGATNIDGGNRFTQMDNWSNSSLYRNELLSYDSRAGIPDGYRHPGAWVMPSVAGGLTTVNNIIGVGGLTLAIQQAREAQALLTGSGTILSPIAGLVVQVAAALLGAGGILPVTPQLIANLTALLVGVGGANAAAAGLADLAALLVGTGDIDGGNTALMDLSVIIRGYGDLTPEGLRDAVWNATATSYDTAGTMGEKLNDAGSAGNPWASVIESGYTAGEILSILAAVASGRTQITDLGGGNATVVFRDLGNTLDRVEADVTGSERTNVTFDP